MNTVPPRSLFDGTLEASVLSHPGFLDTAYNAIICMTADGIIQFVNATTLSIFGYSEKAEIVGKSAAVLMAELPSIVNDIASAKEGLGKDDGLRRITARQANGKEFWTEVHLSRLDVQGEALTVAFVHDLTEAERQEGELNKALYSDSLTKLPNRNYLTRYLDDYFAAGAGKPVRILLLGVDHMPTINTTFGLSGGDRLLQIIAAAVRVIFDTAILQSRVRGRHFAIVTDEDNGALRARTAMLGEYVSRAFAQALDLPHSHLLSTFSGGCIDLPQLAASTEETFRCLDLSRELVKSQGPGSVVFCQRDDLDQRLLQSALPFRISEALQNEDFQVFLQPKQSLHHGLCIGGECLIRWIHPDGTATPPDRFITTAEAAGLIGQIGEFVFRTACRYIAKLTSNHPSLRISINVSPIELKDSQYGNRIKAILDEFGISPWQIELELTETAITQFNTVELESLDQLRADGFTISLDDFGTGTSSLANLATLPIDRVKLDRSFVSNIDENERSYVLVKHAIEIARELGKEITVEGVETHEVRELVKLLGADEVQGFIYAKPKPLSAFEDFLMNEGEGRATADEA